MRDRGLGAARLAAAATLLGVPCPAAAQTPAGGEAPAAAHASSLVAGPSTCPLPATVWDELGTLVPRERFEARLRAAAGATPPVEILDLGATYRIIAAGRARTYRDDARDCANRARIAALFVALAIDPADVMTEAPPPRPLPLPPPAPPVLPASIERPLPRPVARLELGGAADAGVGPSATVLQAGVSLAAAVGRGRLAGVARVVLLAPVDTDFGGVRVHQWRVPFAAGVRGHLDGRRVEPYAELGLEAAWLSERAPDLAAPQSQTALELGVGASLGAHLAGRLGPFAALHAEVVPTPPAIFALPQGVVGHTPTLWVGLSAGLSLGLGR